MTANELGGRVNHDVRPMLDGPDQVGGAEGVVDDQRQAVVVGNFGNGVRTGGQRERCHAALQGRKTLKILSTL